MADYSCFASDGYAPLRARNSAKTYQRAREESFPTIIILKFQNAKLIWPIIRPNEQYTARERTINSFRLVLKWRSFLAYLCGAYLDFCIFVNHRAYNFHKHRAHLYVSTTCLSSFGAVLRKKADTNSNRPICLQFAPNTILIFKGSHEYSLLDFKKVQLSLEKIYNLKKYDLQFLVDLDAKVI